MKVFGKTWTDEDTGQILGEDMYGEIHILPPDVQVVREEPLIWQRLLINGLHRTDWPNTLNFHTMSNDLDEGAPVKFLVPVGFTAHLTSVVAAQSKPGLSLIGMFVNGVYAAHTPLYSEIAHSIITDLPVLENTELEIKFWPHDKKSQFSLLIGGYLSNGP